MSVTPFFPPQSGLALLVVEDSAEAAEALRLAARALGLRLRRADSLAAARRHLRAWRPAAVLVDIGLPDGPGTELLAELAGARPRIGALLALSGDPGQEGPARAAGADAFLPKPLSATALAAALRAHLPVPGQAPPAGVFAPR